MEGDVPTFDDSEVPSSVPPSSGEDKEELQNPIKMEEDFGGSFQNNDLSTEAPFASWPAAQPHDHDLPEIHPASQDFPGNQAPSLRQSSAIAMLPESATPGSYPATQYDEDLDRIEDDLARARSDLKNIFQIMDDLGHNNERLLRLAQEVLERINSLQEQILSLQEQTITVLKEELDKRDKEQLELKEELDKRDKEQLELKEELDK